MSRNGRYVALRRPDGIDIVDALGPAPRRSLTLEVLDYVCVGSMLWVVSDGQLIRYAMDGTEDELPEIGERTALTASHGRLYPVTTRDRHSALWLGYERLLVREIDGEAEVEDISNEAPATAFVGLLGGRRILIAEGQTLRVRDVGRSDVAEAHLPIPGQVVACASLFGGGAMSVLLEGEEGDAFITMRPAGAVIHNVALPSSELWAAADNRGVGVVYDPEADRLIALDLRYGKIQARVEAPLRQVADVSIDADGKYLTLAGLRREDELDDDEIDGDEDVQTGMYHLLFTDLFGASVPAMRSARPAADKRSAGKLATSRSAGKRPHTRTAPKRSTRAELDAAEGAQPLPSEEEEATPQPSEPVVIPQGPLLGLGTPLPPMHISEHSGGRPYANSSEHLDALLDMVTARAYLVITEAWDSGLLSFGANDALPFQREVLALIGQSSGLAPDLVEAAGNSVHAQIVEMGERATASIQAGLELPFTQLLREFSLNSDEAELLISVAAPRLRGEIARLYGILANDENRPLCDPYLLNLLLGGLKSKQHGNITRLLSPERPLVKYGLVRLEGGSEQPFTSLSIDDALLQRLRGEHHSAGPSDITTLRYADRSLEQLLVPDELKRDIVLSLLARPRDGRPFRVLLRGRRGSGRRTLGASLAARIDKPLAVIDCERLPRTGLAFAHELGDELTRAGLRGAVACVSALEVFDATDPVGVEHIRAVFRNCPAPIIIRTTPEFQPPIDPGYLSFSLPPLSESERFAFWTDTLARRGFHAEGIDRLASRFRIGPGTIEAVISSAAAHIDNPDEDATEAFDRAARQHIQTRMSSVATYITKLADWHQVALPEDVHDSIREFIGRVRHRRTVYDNWGFDARMSTSRGLTALFYGPPGTGKSMVAGLIARELGLDLYRVDLARITSKWIGETEKNLAEVFDAAEDGQCIILFDEADSLFAKRTEVKSSVDRYANLEVNYLLQRLDTFEGVAILTTNLEGSIDKAFKRRMSLRLAFPFPDEDMRVRLWAAHIPPEVPIEGDFDFAELARRFPMSGGYIRNSALRAAFLAAQENVAMTHGHLERAIHLEYREMGKLAPGGRLE
ncbi:AAA ATPase central domain protein [Haliangium ochraceum DSM 14365]|uniref:AAA ATPase central domain protein n=2 Tax=Haliangium ochraceum TaxID=80816 RepID=D0LJU6_HALO1|nr:AAA ATPase central domain protein [Haliangium ochraceum DSM 14365]